jgi:hypothetical protein
MQRAMFPRAARHLKSLQVTPSPASLKWYGTAYGGRYIDDDTASATISPDSYSFSAGAGEDVSFDIDLQRRYGCHVVIADPTPRAIEHFESLLRVSRRGESLAINRSRNSSYDLGNVDLRKIHFVPVAVWNESTTLKLWSPANPEHVSHSVGNLEQTTTHIEVPTRSIGDIMAPYGATDLPIVKLDIMGSECEVVKDMVMNGILPSQLSVKFYSLHNPSRKDNDVVINVVNCVHEKGYELLHFDGKLNCLFRRLSAPREAADGTQDGPEGGAA